jgi:hypothetical protein
MSFPRFFRFFSSCLRLFSQLTVMSGNIDVPISYLTSCASSSCDAGGCSSHIPILFKLSNDSCSSGTCTGISLSSFSYHRPTMTIRMSCNVGG